MSRKLRLANSEVTHMASLSLDEAKDYACHDQDDKLNPAVKSMLRVVTDYFTKEHPLLAIEAL